MVGHPFTITTDFRDAEYQSADRLPGAGVVNSERSVVVPPTCERRLHLKVAVR